METLSLLYGFFAQVWHSQEELEGPVFCLIYLGAILCLSWLLINKVARLAFGVANFCYTPSKTSDGRITRKTESCLQISVRKDLGFMFADFKPDSQALKIPEGAWVRVEYADGRFRGVRVLKIFQ